MAPQTWDILPALTLTQPWASLMMTTNPATGRPFKAYETRSWQTHYRGPVAIHAAIGMSKADRQFAELLMEYGFPIRSYELTRGAILGVVRIQEVWPINDALMIAVDDLERALGDYSQPGRFAWVCSPLLALTDPIPIKGKLGLWHTPYGLDITRDGPAITKRLA